MKLLIVIPALNEEASIESIIRRSLDARAQIIANSPVDEVEITVVSDGSTDRTVEIARRFQGDVQLIVFEKNRGYGAAIKAGWLASDADLLGFIDADGTCDPEFFADLCAEMVRSDLDIVLGSRLNGQSEMPLVRRVGNMLFATMLSSMASDRVRDTASGMRVVRRSCLPELMPLPDGLHFTPAMSARAMLGVDITIGEIDMPYQERTGESKLKVGRDGLRFLEVILATAFLYRPSRLLNAVGVPLLAVAAALMATPTRHFFVHDEVAEWMIYRFVVSNLLAVAALLLFCCAHLANRTVAATLSCTPPESLTSRIMRGVLESRFFWALPVALLVVGSVLVVPSLFTLVPTGRTTYHWSRFVVMSFFFTVALVLAATRVLDLQIERVRGRLTWLRSSERAMWVGPATTVDLTTV